VAAGGQGKEGDGGRHRRGCLQGTTIDVLCASSATSIHALYVSAY
jgi:hypothetical protein